MWRPSSSCTDILVSDILVFSSQQRHLPRFPFTNQLHDPTGTVIAFYRSLRQTRYQIGDVYGELHLLRAAGAGTIVSSFLYYIYACMDACMRLSLAKSRTDLIRALFRCILQWWTPSSSPPCFIDSAVNGTFFEISRYRRLLPDLSKVASP